MSGKIAFFDFDGTITTKDTMMEFIRYEKGDIKFYLGLLLISPFVLAYKLGVIKKITAKQRFIGFFFKGETLTDFDAKCKAFSRNKLPQLIRPKALEEIRKLKAAGVPVVIVSASAENWIRDWANENGLELMGTRLAVSENKITGSFNGENCYGNEKVCRIREKYQPEDYSQVFAYGDSSGDKEMLAMATHAFSNHSAEDHNVASSGESISGSIYL